MGPRTSVSDTHLDVYKRQIMDTKKEKNCSDGTKGVLVSGVPAKQVKVDEIQYFIDMKIEGMILGVLWIMMIGWQLDKSLSLIHI